MLTSADLCHPILSQVPFTRDGWLFELKYDGFRALARTGRSGVQLLSRSGRSSGITLRADLPGVPKEKLKLQVEAGTLTIEGEVSIAMPEGMEATYAEVSVPRFRRVFTLSKELDTGKVSAEFKHGVLSLRIPKAEHAQPRRIDIKVS